MKMKQVFLLILLGLQLMLLLTLGKPCSFDGEHDSDGASEH
jgi:hypothetical protein